MKYLGIDYGKKKIGLAISEGELAEPFMMLEVSGLKDAMNKVLKIVKDEAISEVIVGMPESGEARKITQSFVGLLKKDITVVEAEETLSSKRAQDLMIDLGLPKNQEEDEYAAAYILQEYLDSKKML